MVALVAAQALGIVAADAQLLDSHAARIAGLLAAAAAIASHRRRSVATALAIVAMGCAGALALASQLEAAARARPAAPRDVAFEATVRSSARFGDGVELDLADVVAAPGAPARVPEHVRVRSRGEATPFGDALPGDRLRVRARLRAPEGRANPGGRDRARDLARCGVGAVGSLLHPDEVVRLADREGVRPLAWLHAFRAAAAGRLRREGEGGALLAALAVGDRGGLDAQRRDAFRVLGLTHLLSVSGLHLVLVGTLLYAIAIAALRRAPPWGDRRRVALGIASLAATGYALAAGFEVPVRRSLVLLLALAASVWLRRPVRRGAPLLVAALAILAVEPEALFDAGAQMSFLASAALIFGARRDTESRSGAASGWRAQLGDLLATSALATAATAPVTARILGNVSPWGLLANLVAVPWTGFALMPIALPAGLLAGTMPDTPFVGLGLRAASALGAWSLDALGYAARLAPAPWTAQPSLPFVIAAAVAAILAVRATRPGPRVAWALGIVVGLALAPPPRVVPAPPRVVHFDVGQGDATLVQGRRAAILIDAGTALPDGADLGATVVVPALRALGVERLERVVVSHGDLDHRGGVAAVLRAIPAERLWLPPGGVDDPAFGSLIATARDRGIRVEERGAGAPDQLIGDLHVATLWPPQRTTPPLADNDRSLTLRIDVAGRSVLLAGDIQAAAEAALLASDARLRADVLKLSHHGSRTSSTRAFLGAVGAEVAVASAPRFGRFGMPHPEVVQRVREAGASLWWTGRDGAVLIGLDPTLWVRGWR